MPSWDVEAVRGGLRSLGTRLGELLQCPVRVAVNTSGPVGATYTRPDWFALALTASPREVRVQTLWLPPSHRGTGKGRGIVAAIATLGARHAIQRIRVEPRPGSEAFWAACGFQPDSHGRAWYRRCAGPPCGAPASRR